MLFTNVTNGNKTIKRWFVSLFLLLLFNINTFSQTANLKFDHIGVNDGLSLSYVTCILQDNRGFMWFGTPQGLNKYDGYRFTVYTNTEGNSQSLSNNHIKDIAEDLQGNIWVATMDGLNMYDREKDNFVRYQFKKDDPSSISSNYISTVYCDRSGKMWIGTQEGGETYRGGLNYYDKETDGFVYLSNDLTSSLGNSSEEITLITEDSEDNLWIGGNLNGLHLYDRETKKLKSFNHVENESHTPISKDVKVIFEDTKKNIWVGTQHGLYLANRKTSNFSQYNRKTGTHFADQAILSISEDLSGNLWIGTENYGLTIFNPETKSLSHHTHDISDPTGINSNSIYSIVKDTKGNMWLGTFSGGVNLYNIDGNKFKHYRQNPSENSLNNNVIFCIREDSKGNILLGTDGGGLNILDSHGVFTYYKHEEGNPNSICGNHVLSVLEDSDGNIWVGTWGAGVTKLNREKNTFAHYKHNPADSTSLGGDNAWVIYEDSDKDIWIGTYRGGLSLYQPQTDNFINYKVDKTKWDGINSNLINSILEDKDGNLWIGTNNGGMDYFDKKTKIFSHYQHENDNSKSISNNIVTNIREDSLGNLWIGTANGLNYFDKKSSNFKVYTTKDGLPHDYISAIIDDSKGNLWISTNGGLSRFNVKTETFKNFTVADGLQNLEFKIHAALKSRSGKIYLGGINGFNEFMPENNLDDRPFDPPLVLTEFYIFNKPILLNDATNKKSTLIKPISETKSITISYKESVISFEFATLNYTSASKKQYAYMLEGFDKEWNYIGAKRTATYTNLDPGKYIFKVKGLNNNGEWSDNLASTELIVTPPFWKTWWFLSLLTIIFFGGIGTIFQVRTKRSRMHREELERQVKERTEQLERITLEEKKARLEAEKAKMDSEKAKIEAEEANSAKSIFLATMSHEIRTPMNGVIGMASLLSETKLSHEQKEFTDTIQSCGESLLNVINDILDFSKIESGNMDLDAHDFDLRTCIEEVLDLFAQKVSKKDLDLIYQMDYNVPAKIIGDGLRLRQILINLIGNAIKFTAEGEIFIRVSLLHQENTNLVLGFEVKDSGIGIPQEKINKLFKAFSQVDSSTTRKYGGTGLGLVICEKLIHLMGGQIEVESSEGVGTTFKFSINVNSSTQSTMNYVHSNNNTIIGRRILVVDDNGTNRNILDNQMKSWKLIPTLAASAEEALDILAKEPPFDLVLTDMHMPEMDGFELAQIIRNKFPSLPMILLSSVGDDKHLKEKNLFSSVLTKPVRHESLYKHIISVFRQYPGNKKEEIKIGKQLLDIEISESYPLKILVAEDNIVNQKLALIILKKLGYEADVASNGREVLEAMNTKDYNFILMDVQMPEMDGLETTAEIRKKRLATQPIIVAVTANAMQGDREMCIKAGMDDYVSKPIRLEEIIEVLKKWSLSIEKQY